MIRSQESENIWRITIDRPEKANSLTEEMLADLTKAVKRAGKTAKAIVLTGVGKVFSAGADLEQTGHGLAVSPLWEELSGEISRSPCMTIAALNGTVAGGAFGMVLACDLRIAVPTAKFFYPVMKLGFLPQPSDPIRMANVIGPARTKMILMAGQKVGADQALSWGLIDQIVEFADLEIRADQLLADGLAADATHIAAIKGMIS